jgi:hypothetical protein
MTRPAKYAFLALTMIFAGVGRCVAQTPETLKNQREDRIVAGTIQDAMRERPLLIRIAACKDNAAFSQIDEAQVTSIVGRIIYATKFYEFNPGEGAFRVLETLPKSDLQMQALSEFVFRPDNTMFLGFDRKFYSAMFKSVVKYPQFIDAVFRVAGQFDSIEWYDVEAGEWFCSQMGPLQRALPNQWREAVARLKPKERVSAEDCLRWSNSK